MAQQASFYSSVVSFNGHSCRCSYSCLCSEQGHSSPCKSPIPSVTDDQELMPISIDATGLTALTGMMLVLRLKVVEDGNLLVKPQ